MQQPPVPPTRKRTIWYREHLREEVRNMPKLVRHNIGVQLRELENGNQPNDFKPMPTIGIGVNEIRTSEHGNQYRLIYIAKFEEGIYELHVITKKKSQQTSKTDVEIAKWRYRELIEARKKANAMKKKTGYKPNVVKEESDIFTVGSGNIFVDFGFSEEESVALSIKADLFDTLQTALKKRNAKQVELGALLDLPQSKVSDIVNDKMSGFSIERIITLLAKLKYDVRVEAHPMPENTHKLRARG
jgi:phage-related protein/predicted XRE-type DNA-binding protein